MRALTENSDSTTNAFIASRRLSRSDAVGICTLILLASALLALGLADGNIGLSEDSWYYRDVARHLAAGEGVVTENALQARPVTRWPPGYPLLLAPGEIVGMGVESWAFAMNFVLLGILIGTVYALLRIAGLHWSNSAAGALLVLFGNGLLVQFGMLLSEALFLPLEVMFIGTLLLSRPPAAKRWIVVAALLAAAASLTRFSGEGFILGGLGFFLFDRSASPGCRIRSGVSFFLVAQVPVFSWLARNWILTGAISDLGFAPRIPEGDAFLNLWRVFTTFWLPEGLSRWFRHGLATLLLACAFLGNGVYMKHHDDQVLPLVRASSWCILGYVSFLLWTYFSSRSLPHLDLRMMLPVLIPMALILVTAGRSLEPALRRFAALLIVVLLLVGAVRVLLAIDAMRSVGPYSAWLHHGAAP